MSLADKKLITCPKCGTKNYKDIYGSINVTNDYALRDMVLNGDIFNYHCAACGLNTKMYYPFLYHDMKHKFMVQFDPSNDYDENEFKAITNMNPMQGYRYRIVNKPFMLIDKILLLESKYDDKVIEVLKEFLKATNNTADVAALSFAVTKDNTYEFICINSANEAIGIIPFNDDLYQMIYDKFYSKLKDIDKYHIDKDFAEAFLNEVEI